MSAPREEVLGPIRQAVAGVGGVSAVASAAGLSRRGVYVVVGPEGNPRLSTLLALLKATDLHLAVRPIETVP